MDSFGGLLRTAGTVLFYVCSVRDVLLGTKRGKEQELGGWGFTVDASGKTKEPGETGNTN